MPLELSLNTEDSFLAAPLIPLLLDISSDVVIIIKSGADDPDVATNVRWCSVELGDILLDAPPIIAGRENPSAKDTCRRKGI